MEQIETRAFAKISDGTDYTFLCMTDMSEILDDLFWFNYIENFSRLYNQRLRGESTDLGKIDEPEIFMNIEKIITVKQSPIIGLTGKIQIPVSNEVTKNLNSSRAFMVAHHESEKVVDYFVELAKKVGFFFALPYDEIITSRNNNIDTYDLERATEEGYLRIGLTNQYDNKLS